MKPLFSVIQSRSFRCFVVCCLVLFQRMAGTGYSKTYASPPDNAHILAMSRYSYYTTEDKGHVLLSLPEAFQGRLVSADLLFEGKTIVENFSVRAGERTFIPFQFKQGNSYCFSIWAKTKDERRQSTGLGYGGFFKKLFPWIRTRFIRVKSKNIGICPPWHRGAGGKAWIFADEIIVN